MSHVEKAGDRYWRLVEPSWIRLNDSWSRGVGQFLVACQNVSPKVLHLYAGHWCQAEVNNGGFHQFFGNTTGILAPEAVGAFNAIGLLEWSSLLSEAMGFFPTPYPRERAVRVHHLPRADGRERAQWDPFAALDDKFYSSGDAGRWESAADAYAVSAA